MFQSEVDQVLHTHGFIVTVSRSTGTFAVAILLL